MMQHIKQPNRDGTCELGFCREGDLCVSKSAPRAEIEKEKVEFHKSLRAPRKQPVKEISKRAGIPLIKG